MWFFIYVKYVAQLRSGIATEFIEAARGDADFINRNLRWYSLKKYLAGRGSDSRQIKAARQCWVQFGVWQREFVRRCSRDQRGIDFLKAALADGPVCKLEFDGTLHCT